MTLWCFVVLEALLLLVGWDWSGVLSWSVMILVAAVPWLRFVVAWRQAPEGFGKSAGFDPLLVLFVVLAYLALFLYRLALTPFGGWTALILCAAWLVAAGTAYRWRRRRRRRRYGG